MLLPENKIAIIDLGTNTCNLLIASHHSSGYSILYQGKEAVKLGKGGIDKRTITPDATRRAIASLQKHQQTMLAYGVQNIIAIATSAVRDASNQDEFQQQIKHHTGIDLTVISGEKEAELIFKGVLLAFGRPEDNSLILDIGGGSNEFILCRNGQPIWKESFPLGMARVVEQMPPSDPATPEEIKKITDWYQNGLKSLWQHLDGTQIPLLIGCSGAFDTIVDLIDETVPGTKRRKFQEITPEEFSATYSRLISSTSAERLKMKGMEPIRVEMIVPAIIFIKLILEKLQIRKICQTDYALREGVLYDLIYN